MGLAVARASNDNANALTYAKTFSSFELEDFLTKLVVVSSSHPNEETRMRTPFLQLTVAFTMAVCALAPTASQAQTGDGGYPQRALKLVVPFPAGGGVDAVGRLLAERLSANLRQPVLVDNRPGAGGALGTLAVARSPADGYTLLLNTNGHAILPHLQKTEWDAVADFVPISQVLVLPMMVFTNVNSPIKSLGDLITAAKANPGKVSYGSSGIGGPIHLGMEMFASQAGIKLLHVPYRGNAPMVTALLGGEVAVTLDTLAVSYPQVRAGKFRAIATTSPTRLKIAPDVPTIHEAGVSGFDYLGWQGILAPAGTPPSVVARLSAELRKILEMPSVRQKLEELGYEPRNATPEEFLAIIKDDSVRYRKVILDAQIKAE